MTSQLRLSRVINRDSVLDPAELAQNQLNTAFGSPAEERATP
jgi:hypothetical protein